MADTSSSTSKEGLDAALSVHDAVVLARMNLRSLPKMVVVGEVSGFKGTTPKGHCFFQLKDEQSAMEVVVWANVYQSFDFKLEDGLKIQVQGNFDVYEGKAELRFHIKHAEIAGEGLLRQKIHELEMALRKEGIIDEARKKPVPQFCERVGLVTSLSSSVIEDVKRTLARRNPLVSIDVFGCTVQGVDAVPTIIRALRAAEQSAPDCILLVRGGGSLEDLMCFNDEQLARAIAACHVPVVTGIGHEPDTSIADYVADKQCSTPTAAAESVAPTVQELRDKADERAARLQAALELKMSNVYDMTNDAATRSRRALANRLETHRVELETLAKSRPLANPSSIVLDKLSKLAEDERRLSDALPHFIRSTQQTLDTASEHFLGAGRRLVRPYAQATSQLERTLQALSPLQVLSRGYAIVRDKQGHVISDAAELSPGDLLELLLGSGTAEVCVNATQPAKKGSTKDV